MSCQGTNIYNICQDQNRTFRLGFTFTQPDGTPLDLTGVVIKMQVRNSANALFLELSVGSGIVVATPTNGQIQLFSNAINFEAGTYKYDIKFTFLSGDIETFVKGTFTVIKTITV